MPLFFKCTVVNVSVMYQLFSKSKSRFWQQLSFLICWPLHDTSESVPVPNYSRSCCLHVCGHLDIHASMLNLNHCLYYYDYKQYSGPLLLFMFSLIWLCFIEGVQDVAGVNNRPRVVNPRWGRRKQSLSVSPPDFASCSLSSPAIQNLCKVQTVNSSSSFFVTSLLALWNVFFFLFNFPSKVLLRLQLEFDFTSIASGSETEQ